MQFETSTATKGGQTSTVYDISKQVLKNLENLGLEYLIAIGGDDTLSYAATLDRLGFNVIAIPKTMDNDVQNTEYCIGFSTAITRATDAINRQRTTVGSHERIGVFRVFGRDAGFTALYTAYVTSIRCVIPEYKVELDKLIELLVTDKRNNPSNYTLVVLSEGARMARLHGPGVRRSGRVRAPQEGERRRVTQRRDQEARQGRHHRQRLDLRPALGRSGFRRQDGRVDLRNDGARRRAGGQERADVGLVNGCYDLVPIPDPKLGPRKVDLLTMYNTERYRPIYANKRGLPIFLNRT